MEKNKAEQARKTSEDDSEEFESVSNSLKWVGARDVAASKKDQSKKKAELPSLLTINFDCWRLIDHQLIISSSSNHY